MVIAQEVERGIRTAGMASSTYAVIPDRFQAIRAALNLADQGAVVVVAGKGHETEWVVGTQRIPFNDREIVEGLLHGPDAGALERTWQL